MWLPLQAAETQLACQVSGASMRLCGVVDSSRSGLRGAVEQSGVLRHGFEGCLAQSKERAAGFSTVSSQAGSLRALPHTLLLPLRRVQCSAWPLRIVATQTADCQTKSWPPHAACPLLSLDKHDVSASP